MIDAHVHLEKGNYCVDWIQEFMEMWINNRERLIECLLDEGKSR